MDEVVWSFLHAFFGHQLFFVKLFAWAETSVGDFDVYIRGVAGKLDQVSGKGVDLYRGSHVQDEDLAAFGVGSCLEDKAYGLRDSHKVADDVRMCDGDRAAFFDLALEQRDHTSPTHPLSAVWFLSMSSKEQLFFKITHSAQNYSITL